MKSNRSTYFFIFSVCLFFALNSCKRDRRLDDDKVVENVDESSVGVFDKTRQTLQTVNFYLENSGSMNGYANGNTDFKKAVVKLLSDLELELDNGTRDSIKINLVNMEVYPFEQDYLSFNELITTKGIPKKGDVSNSDINSIFSQLLGTTTKNQVSILVTDAIYSLEKEESCDNLIGMLETKKFDTRNLFVDELEKSNLSTLVIKLNSDFKGYYYPAEGGSVNIDQERPYYIWLFGDSQLLRDIDNRIGLKSLPGYQNDFFVLKNEKVETPYSILKLGDGKLGDFSVQGRDYPVTAIEYEDKHYSGEFGFAIVADLSNVPLPESYLIDLDRYQSSNEYYQVYNISSLKDATLNKNTENHIRTIEESMSAEFTHIIYLKAKEKFIQEVSISLINQVPIWVERTNNDCDTKIQEDTETTFGFGKLASGIIDAYSKVNDSDAYLTLKFRIKS